MSGGWDGNLCQWDLESGTLIRRLAAAPRRGDRPGHLPRRPTGPLRRWRPLRPGSGSREPTWESGCGIWSPGPASAGSTGTRARSRSVAFSPDGRRGRFRARWTGPRASGTSPRARSFAGSRGTPVRSAAVQFLPEGTRVLSGGDDRKLRLWDAATGRELRSFDGHSSDVIWVAVSPDGRHAVSSSLRRPHPQALGSRKRPGAGVLPVRGSVTHRRGVLARRPPSRLGEHRRGPPGLGTPDFEADASQRQRRLANRSGSAYALLNRWLAANTGVVQKQVTTGKDTGAPDRPHSFQCNNRCNNRTKVSIRGASRTRSFCRAEDLPSPTLLSNPNQFATTGLGRKTGT